MPGICNIYEFLAYEHPEKVNRETHKVPSQHDLNATPTNHSLNLDETWT